MGESKRYRGRQRMISEAIFNSPDFMGFTTFDVLIYVGMVIYADDEGRVCADPRWLHRRMLGELSSPKDSPMRIKKLLSEGVRRKIFLPCDPPPGSCNDHKYVQINNWGRHNRIKLPGREDKIREDKRIHPPPTPPEGGGEWGEFERQAKEAGVKSPKGLSRKLRSDGVEDPREAGFEWYTPPEVRHRRSLIRQIRSKHLGASVSNGARVTEAGLGTNGGSVPWSEFTDEQLEELVGRLDSGTEADTLASGKGDE